MSSTRLSPRTPTCVAKPRLSHGARDDLREIRIYSKAAFGPAAALDYIEGLRAALKQIGVMPMLGTAENALGNGLRSRPFRSHRIYYRVQEPVLIVRILHHAQDAGSQLGRMN